MLTFLQNSPSEILDWVLNTPLIFTAVIRSIPYPSQESQEVVLWFTTQSMIVNPDKSLVMSLKKEANHKGIGKFDLAKLL